MASKTICRYLKGDHKPILGGPSKSTSYILHHYMVDNLCSINCFLILGDCGDHVVVINSQDIALKGDEWFYRVYFHHTGYPGGATWTKAYELHQKDPTMV